MVPEDSLYEVLVFFQDPGRPVDLTATVEVT